MGGTRGALGRNGDGGALYRFLIRTSEGWNTMCLIFHHFCTRLVDPRAYVGDGIMAGCAVACSPQETFGLDRMDVCT